MLFKPAQLAGLGLIAYLAVWLIAPVKAVQPMSVEAVAYISACYLLFFLGCYSFSAAPRMVSRASLPRRPTAWLFWLIGIIGLMGLIFRSYDKYILRGVSFGSDALEGRESLANSDAGPLSLIGGVLFPFCYIPMILYLSDKKPGKGSLLKFVFALGLFIYPALDALVLLSRSAMLVSVCYAFLAWRYFGGRGQLLTMRSAAWIIGIVLLLMLGSGWVFSQRLSEQALDFTFSILNSGYAFTVQPSDWTLNAIQDNYFGMNWFFLVLSNICQYFLHGMLEFSYLLQHSEYGHSWGCETLNPYFKAIKILGVNIPCPDSESLYPRVGIFTTFFGPLWIDFGLLGLPLMYVFGIVSAYFASRARREVIFAVPLYLYFVVVILLMPVVNFVSSAQGMYVINAFLIFNFMSRIRSFRRNKSLNHAPRLVGRPLVRHESP